ncbi:hypothetical protein Rfer_3056 [Rhodoferax ferrireducens T118]|uniref:Uncharacterized protein n=1 Tax=Albidiferax ferrireducens (strain ATCC BAA-621 / DSM 15236 / T118) TaxID=338969 RepID=Q21TY7_ALBFT|nr:hypothetical protein [Rhodoferax ferrireducens]ABD70766.1 hypothetical protein Rfer_3056 [Rhodoferax ferrireducens T118]
MRQEELWEWRIKWLGQWTSTIHGVTEAEIRKIHPEAIRVLGSRCVRQIAETPDDLRLLMGTATNPRLLGVLKNCEVCEHFGGWHPIHVGEKISYRTHSGCLRQGAPKTVAQPERGCAYWARKEEPVQRVGAIA